MRASRGMIPAALGAVAVMASMALLALQIILALPRPQRTSSTKIAATLSAILESANLVFLTWMLFLSTRKIVVGIAGVLFGSAVGLCVVTAAATVATLICLSNDRFLGANTAGFLAGTALALILSFASQLLFLVARFITNRTYGQSRSNTPGMQEIGRSTPTLGTRVKTVPYSSTTPPEPASRNVSMDFRNPPSSSGGFSAAETFSSVASSLTNVVRPITSKTQLLQSSRSMRSVRSQRSQHSQQSIRRPPSLELTGQRDRSNTAESFDNWDTSSVDPQHRLTVIESASVAAGRFLETIPASPTTSRSPSPGTPLNMESPCRTQQRRSRSFSPSSTRSDLPKPPKRAFTQHSMASDSHIEAHIHPLFRSDSPTPPPLTSPSTVILAAPQAGQVISDRQSIRSLNRMRSGSLPAVSSPLSAMGSFDSFPFIKTTSVASDSSTSDASGETPGQMPERKVTPPIPDYILKAGSQTSLHAYQARKTQSRDGPSGPGLDALPMGRRW